MIASAVLANQCIYCSADIVLLHQYYFINLFLRQPTTGEHLQGHLSNLGLVDSSSTSFGTWARHIMLIIMKYRSVKLLEVKHQKFSLLTFGGFVMYVFDYCVNCSASYICDMIYSFLKLPLF